ncbi:MAG TPA: cytochrome C oxidase subunit IV family protein [Candidatus Binatia bacterium]|nr:cytochrome C oxidase subunit IV family protein [Candidatus Binatia bacterium]
MKSEPVVSIGTYALVFLTLLVLTALTTAIAFVDLGGGWNNVVALTIAVGKAVLVILYFMHVRYSDKLTWVFVAAGFFWLLIMLGGIMEDVRTRPSLSPETASTATQFHTR